MGVAENMGGAATGDDGGATDAKMNMFLTLLMLLSYELAILSGFLFYPSPLL